MLGKVLGVVAGLALGAAVTTAGVANASALPAAAPHWHIVKSVKTGLTGDFTAVVATGKTTGWAFDGYAASSGPAAWERDGSTWAKVAFPGKSNEYVACAGATSPSDVWAFTANIFGTGSRVLRWNGHKWSVVKAFTDAIGGASVLAGDDVWVFGRTSPTGLPTRLGVWHYNGRTWSQASKNLDGGSALSASNVWAYSGTNAGHWNGDKWASASVKSLLPPRQQLNDPLVTGIIALSASNVYAVGNGNLQDEGGPAVVLHDNGHQWTKVAEGSISSYSAGQQISTDGSGGLWLPMPGPSGAPSSLVHYRPTSPRCRPRHRPWCIAPLPVSGQDIDVESVARIPGTTQALADGFTHAPDNPAGNVVAVIPQYS